MFWRERVAVFIDGCYWHGCPEHCRLSGANLAWWESKIAENRARDRDTDAQLQAAGWVVVRSWSHEGPDAVAAKVETLVRRRRGSLSADD